MAITGAPFLQLRHANRYYVIPVHTASLFLPRSIFRGLPINNPLKRDGNQTIRYIHNTGTFAFSPLLLVSISDPIQRMGSDYSTMYGTLPLVPQRPGTLDVLKHPTLVVPSEVHLVFRDQLMTLTDDSGA